MLPKKDRTRPIDLGRSWSRRYVPSSRRATSGAGRYGARWLADGDRARARAAAAVRAGERLVRVVVHQVDPHVARPDDAEDRVHVGAVEVEQGPAIVKQPGDLADLRVEQADRVRVGDHEDGRLVARAWP